MLNAIYFCKILIVKNARFYGHINIYDKMRNVRE